MLEHIQTIRKQANTDYLTELPNRRYFFAIVRKALHQRAKQQQSSAIAMLDIDHFKLVNDNYGHDYGDAVLEAFSRAFKQHFQQDLVARLGGEEFAVFFD